MESLDPSYKNNVHCSDYTEYSESQGIREITDYSGNNNSDE